MKTSKIRAGITHGDINSVSYEIIIKTLMDNRILDVCTPIVYGSAKILAYHRKALNISNFSLNIIKSPKDANLKRGNIINCVDENIRVELGKSTSMAGQASAQALETAVNDLKDGKIDILITAPINKHNIQSDKFQYPGHTEFLQSHFEVDDVLMLMVSEIMKVGVITGHIPLSKVKETITQDLILSKLKILNQSLLQDFTIKKPKIAVLGINPHAGDDGVLGNEEIEIIKPALNRARDEGIMALGPYPSDGFFGSGNFSKFDAVLAMYHDQGLIPFKTLSYDGGINYTAGLPIIRTSPAHGTAYELAGKNEASENSFRKALFLACDIYSNRIAYNEISKNPLTQVDYNEI